MVANTQPAVASLDFIDFLMFLSSHSLSKPHSCSPPIHMIFADTKNPTPYEISLRYIITVWGFLSYLMIRSTNFYT